MDTMLIFVEKFEMRSKLVIFLLLTSFFVACQKNEKNNPNLITKDRIGKLTSTIKVSQLDSLFAEDSLVAKNNDNRFSSGDEYAVYRKGGQEMFRLQPKKSFDSTSTIGSIQVIDTLFQTKEGLGRGSEFKVVKTNYDISRIENTGRTATVFIDELNIYVTIDKKDILEPTQMGTKIKTSQIKDNAKIRHIWLDWE